MKKYELTRIDPKIVKRILLSLYELGTEKRTTISRNANMSYDRCEKYLLYLEKINFVKKDVDESNLIVYGLTSDGFELCKNNLSKSNSSYSDLDKKFLMMMFL